MCFESRMFGKPCLHIRVLVGCVVVHDQMYIEILRNRLINAVEKAQELFVAMARHAQYVINAARACTRTSTQFRNSAYL